MIARIYDVFEISAKGKGIKLDFDLKYQKEGVDDLWIVCDQKRIKQVLMNLISNALKFTDDGSISLSISHPWPGLFKFEVRDTGVGISEENIKKLFRNFGKLED